VRLKENRKVTRKKKRNRMMLREELKGDICVSDPITYMEKMQSALRKLKRWSCRRKEQEEARSLNRQFKQDPGLVFAQLNAILKRNKESERPGYKAESKNRAKNYRPGIRKLIVAQGASTRVAQRPYSICQERRWKEGCGR